MATVRLLVTVVYLDRALRSRTVARDLTDPVAGPFASPGVIVPTVITTDGLSPYAPTVRRRPGA
ncbi:hypothetical protein [Streptomyces sp. NPDC086519]|uniref:hypothetical protein n=1 Tax=Streptomyces sp. NPDC086519 TaxID=3154863 RepID=UPI0034359E12